MNSNEVDKLNNFITCAYELHLSNLILYHWKTSSFCPRDQMFLVPSERWKKLK